MVDQILIQKVDFKSYVEDFHLFILNIVFKVTHRLNEKLKCFVYTITLIVIISQLREQFGESFKYFGGLLFHFII